MLHAVCFPAPRGREPAIEQEVRPPGTPLFPISRRAFAVPASPGRLAKAQLAARGRVPPLVSRPRCWIPVWGWRQIYPRIHSWLLLLTLPRVPGRFASVLGIGLGHLGEFPKEEGQLSGVTRRVTLVTLVAHSAVA